MTRAVLFLVGGVVLANIVWATFFWRAPAQDRPAPIVNSTTTIRAAVAPLLDGERVMAKPCQG